MVETMECPQTIAGFTVIGHVGDGAASSIYAVQDPSDTQVYALKHVVKREPSDERYFKQALTELEVGQKLDHPNIRRIYRMIRQRQLIRTTEMMLLMELVDGVSLKDAVPPTLRGMVLVFHAVARGLSAMHRAGFAHADIKPMNIMRTAGGAVKIIDLGQACPLGTVKERIQGTPDFIAPEQVKRQPITQQTDVFNLGASMYWCLTGTFAPTKLRRPKIGEVRTDGRDPRKAIAASELRSDLPSALNSLVMDCIRSDPARRPRSMDDIRARLTLAMYQLDQRGHEAMV